MDIKYVNLMKIDNNRLGEKVALNEKLENFIEKKRKLWQDRLNPIFDLLKGTDKLEMIESQALALSYHHQLLDEINNFLNKLTRAYSEKSEFQRDRFLFYSTSFSIKTNKSEKDILLNADTREDTRYIQMLEAYIDYMRDCKAICESIQWIIKNKIQLIS